MRAKVHRNIVCSALAGCLALITSGVSAQPLDQEFTWQGRSLIVPIACFDSELSFIVLTPENVGLCADLSAEMTDAFNAALSDDNPENDPVAVIAGDLADVGPATTGSIGPSPQSP